MGWSFTAFPAWFNSQQLQSYILGCVVGVVLLMIYQAASKYFKRFLRKVTPKWQCLGCGLETERIGDDTKVFDDVKYYCMCRERQYVCRPCYNKKPQAAYWEQRFGLNHAVRDNDEDAGARLKRLFGPFLDKMTNGSVNTAQGAEGEIVIAHSSGMGSEVTRRKL